ncbi:MAG: dTDP-4-dehydrorhamnose 3,5-epimerase [Acidobacteria bacterium]|nr:dTDP-4-dehydrorhamnose 3,5-epimerase [Acidobacteriota bacterium]MDW7983681.1 dTDP-4-dehydrorhamnose 3,5-epimerase [Acidobacteriota bacterium]
MPFRFRPLELLGLMLIETQVFEDPRGFFMELYKASEFSAFGLPSVFVQENYSHSVFRVLRGLHYQKRPKAQGKLVRVLRGEVFDVCVDIRRGSPTYGRWTGLVLSDRNRYALYVPPGFAHGFCVLSDEAGVIYKTTAEYDPTLEGGIRWNDPDLGIQWPISDPIVSEKDARLPYLRDAVHDFTYGASEG